MSYVVGRESLEGLREEWLTLLGSRARRVFQHPTWQRIWLEEFGSGREPLFLSVREGGRLAGLASLLRDGDRICLLGDPEICDYMELVAAPGEEKAVLAAMLDALKEEDWREVELWGLAAGSPTLANLPDLARDRGLEVRTELEAVCPQLDLPGTWGEYLERLGKKNRHELRRKLRRLQGVVGETRLEVLRSAAEVVGGMDDFLRLMTLKSEKARFMTPTMERFFRRVGEAMAGEGVVALYMLEADGRRVASTFCFQDAKELLLYNSGYDPQFAALSVGLASKAACVRKAVEDGKRRVDFLRGDEPYKYDLGGRDVEVYRALLSRKPESG
jgi:CelD/BcsL family acetyltransferase involved in cellulose biosynthesis